MISTDTKETRKQMKQFTSTIINRIVTANGTKKVFSEDLKIGDLILISKDERIPADILLLKSFEENEMAFIKTDQLDGETDWKLRKPLKNFQEMDNNTILTTDAYFEFDAPNQKIYDFKGLMRARIYGSVVSEAISLDNTLWQNTVLATKGVLGVVIQTGKETKAQMNNIAAKGKFGVLDEEINLLTQILFGIMILISLIIVLIFSLTPNIWQNCILFFRFVVLMCSIIPISLKINMDISKTINSRYINSDDKLIPETIARNSMIPEELGRIEYLFSDKTGTLTKNEMIFKKLALRTDTYTPVII